VLAATDDAMAAGTTTTSPAAAAYTQMRLKTGRATGLISTGDVDLMAEGHEYERNPSGEDSMLRIGITALATAAFCVAVTAAIALPANSRSHSIVTVKIGDDIVIPGLDLFCSTSPTDADHHDPGPMMYCDRNSVRGRSSIPASLGVSRFHMRIGRTGSNYWAYSVARVP
jgi:hypothetical protein